MKRLRALTVILIVGLLGGPGHTPAHASGTQFITIDDPNNVQGTFPNPFAVSIARGINPQEDIVGQYADSTGTVHGYFRHQDTYTTIDDPNGVDGTIAAGINARGDIAGFYFDRAFTSHGFLLSHGRYTTLNDPTGIQPSTIPMAQRAR